MLHYVNVACTLGNLIIVPSFSCPFSTRLLYIVGSNRSCLWSSSEIEIRNRIDDEFSEFTWFNEETCTSRKMLTAPCNKSDIESLVSILSIAWLNFFPVKWKRARNNHSGDWFYGSCSKFAININRLICVIFQFFTINIVILK